MSLRSSRTPCPRQTSVLNSAKGTSGPMDPVELYKRLTRGRTDTPVRAILTQRFRSIARAGLTVERVSECICGDVGMW